MAKKGIIALGAAVLAVLAALALLRTPDPAPASGPGAAQVQTRPTGPEQTGPVLPEPSETEPARTTGPAETEPAETEPVRTEPVQTQPVETEPVLTIPPTEAPELFPLELEDGMLTVQSVFQFTGMNPDAGLQFGENTAGVQLVNTSELHMTEAEIEVWLTDGTVLTFRAEDVAPGMGVMAFSLEHGALADPAMCADVFGWAEFEEGDPLRSDLVEITVQGVEVTVKNVSGTDLTELDVICHGLLDGSAFGGTAYTYRIPSLSDGASTTILAQDCILGLARVVRVALGE